MVFRKRRVRPAKNKNLAKSLRRQEGQSRPRLGDLYPSVQRLVVDLHFFDSQGNALDEETLEFGPDDQVDFHVPCQGHCGDGRMDLEGKIGDVIRNNETVSESRARCPRILFSTTGDVCGFELRCRIELEYAPAATQSSQPA